MKLHPLGDRVLVKRLAAEDKTESGIFLAPSSTGKSSRGVVIAIGHGKKTDEPIDLKVGDKVLLPKFGGVEATIDGQEYVIYAAAEIIGKYV